MITLDNIRLSEGHIARHIPPGSGAPGREAAIIDIVQALSELPGNRLGKGLY